MDVSDERSCAHTSMRRACESAVADMEGEDFQIEPGHRPGRRRRCKADSYRDPFTAS